MLEVYCGTCDTVVAWLGDLVVAEAQAGEHEDEMGHDVTIREDPEFPQDDPSELPEFVERAGEIDDDRRAV